MPSKEVKKVEVKPRLTKDEIVAELKKSATEKK